MAEFNITDPEIIKMLKGLTEEERQDVADQIQESLDSGEFPKTGVFPEAGNTDYSHNRSSCVVCQEGGIGCPDCYNFICDGCGKKRESKEKKTITTENLAGVVMCEECSGGNTTERVEEQTARLEKIAEQKEINKVVDQVESAAIKAVHKVMEQHNKALEKLAENEE